MTPIHQRKPGLLPADTGPIHFIGIGGIGMSGIAEVLHSLGFNVQGSDNANTPNLQRLQKLGITAFAKHHKNNIRDADVVVVSSAIPGDNPELAAAKEQFIPVIHRSEMLAELMKLKNSIAVTGTHGKTTTTALVSHALWNTHLNPTTINGGIVNEWGSNARIGNSEWMVVEADESDGSFRNLQSTVAVVTNCDPEHMDFWKSQRSLHNAFRNFIGSVPFYGFAALCIDHPVVRKMARDTTQRRVITYGLSPLAEIHAENPQMSELGTRFDLVIAPRGTQAKRKIKSVFLSLMGEHNVQNALAAVAVAHGLGLDINAVAESFAGFSGVKRRFTRVARVSNISFIDDYAHHPAEIQVVLQTARQLLAARENGGRVVAVVQPHRYSRLQAMLAEFCASFDNAAAVFVTPVYAAGEKAREGVSHRALVRGLREHGHRRAKAVANPDELAAELAAELKPHDCVIFLGAGDITRWAEIAPSAVARLLNIRVA